LPKKIHFESPILALRDKAEKVGKASRDAYNRGGWLNFSRIWKNWVAEGVAFKVNNFSVYRT
jgi:hypothetical protein